MKKFISRYGKMTLVALFGLCIFLFWYCGYPQALCYQEQNQLFLWSADYFWHDLSVAGGLADYISEFLVQFYYVPVLGAAILALLFVAFLSLAYQVIRSYTAKPLKWYGMLIALLPSILLLEVMGDIEVLLSFPVAPDLSPAVNMVDESCYQKMGSKDSVGRCTSDTRHILADWRRGNLALCLPPCGFFPDTSKERQTPFRFDYLSFVYSLSPGYPADLL